MNSNENILNKKTTKTNAKIILDSIIDGTRITTFEVTLPRIILAEVNTHKVVSKNYQSSRAIPSKRLFELCTFTPSVWRLNCKGMQPKQNAGKVKSFFAKLIWRLSYYNSKFMVLLLVNVLNIHKEIANRLLEPWMYTTGVLTGTEFALMNLFKLRVHGDAQYEFQELANCMLYEYNKSVPKERTAHIPYASYSFDIDEALINSMAKIARVSYLNINKDKSFEDNKKLAKQLIGSEPKHSSCAEHQAFSYRIFSENVYPKLFKKLNDPPIKYTGNFLTLIQLRKLIEKDKVKLDI